MFATVAGRPATGHVDPLPLSRCRGATFRHPYDLAGSLPDFSGFTGTVNM
jgi:hypothetical protein